MNLVKWDDEVIAERGPDISLLMLMRKTCADFIEHQKVVNFILGMVIVLCVVIFSELALSQSEDSVAGIAVFYYYVNYILLTFFVSEIIVRLFAHGHLFLLEFINIFDSTIVIVSYVMLISKIKASWLGILRVLRLIKVIINIKRVADEKRAQKEFIKEQKRQGSQMASYVERVLDFLERLSKNEEIDKILREDVEWAVEVISANKLYQGGLEGFNMHDVRPEIRAWTDLISMRGIPFNLVEQERLKQYEEKKSDKKENKGIIVKPGYVERNVGGEQNGHQPVKKKKEESNSNLADDSKTGILKDNGPTLGGGKVHPQPDGKQPQTLGGGGNNKVRDTTSDY